MRSSCSPGLADCVVLHLLWGHRRRCVLLAGYFSLLALPDRRRISSLRSVAQRRAVLRAADFLGLAVLPALFLASFLVRGVGPSAAARLHDRRHVRAAASVVAFSTAGMKVVVAMLARLGVFSSWIAVLLAVVTGMVLFAPLGWIAVDLIRRGYEARYFSDTSIVFASIWLFQTLSLLRMLFHSAGHAAGPRSARSSSTVSSPGSACGRWPRLQHDGRRPDCAAALWLQAADRTAVRSAVAAPA